MKVRFLNVTNVQQITESLANKALEACYDKLLAELDRQKEAESNSAPEGDADESVA